METRRLGGLWDGKTKHQAGSVWDINGLSPTIDTMLGGGREPHIMEIWNVRNIYINSREGRRAWVFENGCNSSHGNWGGIAHTVTCREGALCVQHCNLIIEVEKLEEIKELGGLEEKSSQRRKVFDENGVSPTLQAAMGAGGGNVPLVVDAVIGSMQENAMVGNAEYSPSLTEAMGMGGGQIPMITERTCVAMRGRSPENPSNRTPGIELEQRLEVNNTGCTNTLTTVQKDNLVLEKSSFPLRMVRTEEGKALRKDYEARNIHHGFNEYREPECRTDGVSNTVTTVQKDTLLLEKEQVLAYDEQNQTIRTETFGTLTTDGSSPKHNNRVIKIKQATKQGFIECEIGGGILFGISDKRVETRTSNRERTDKPDSDDGEYP